MAFRHVSTVLWGCATVVFVKDLIASVELVKDNSMQPTLHRGDLVLVYKPMIGRLNPGDVVLLRNPEATRGATDLRLFRRLGSKKDYRWGQLNFYKDAKGSDGRDSSDFGPVPEAMAIGKVRAVLFPPLRAHMVRIEQEQVEESIASM